METCLFPVEVANFRKNEDRGSWPFDAKLKRDMIIT